MSEFTRWFRASGFHELFYGNIAMSMVHAASLALKWNYVNKKEEKHFFVGDTEDGKEVHASLNANDG